jgi:hypothetical protein
MIGRSSTGSLSRSTAKRRNTCALGQQIIEVTHRGYTGWLWRLAWSWIAEGASGFSTTTSIF